MNDSKFKQFYTFILLIVTVMWAALTLIVASNEASDSIQRSGTEILLGALLAANTITIQYWFRKKGPSKEEK